MGRGSSGRENGRELTIDQGLRVRRAVLANSRLADDPWDQRLAEVERTAVQLDGKFSREFGEMRASTDWLLRDMLDLNPNNVSGAAARNDSPPACAVLDGPDHRQ